MVTSKTIRPNRKTLTSVIETGTRSKKVTTRVKILQTLTKHKKGLQLVDLAFESNVKSCGNVSQILKFLIRSGEVIKYKCPHCDNTDLYKIPR